MSNRSKFVEAIALEIGVDTDDLDDLDEVDKLLMQVISALRKHLLDEGEAVFPGFGRLLIKERPARKGLNPKTGAPIDIPAKSVVEFRSFPGVFQVKVE
jgi:DNA-binding protein HU-beta